MKEETIAITPFTPRVQKELARCKIQIYDRDEDGVMKWLKLSSDDEFYPVAACLELFIGWGWVNHPVRIVTESGRLVCANEAYYTKRR